MTLIMCWIVTVVLPFRSVGCADDFAIQVRTCFDGEVPLADDEQLDAGYPESIEDS